jgi:hypothetical protein
MGFFRVGGTFVGGRRLRSVGAGAENAREVEG